MCRKNIIADDKKISKNNFCRNRKPFIINDKDVNKILVSGKEPYKKAHLKTGYNDNDDIRPSCITLSRMIGYAKYFNSNKTMSIGKRLLKKVYQDMVKD